MAEYFILKREPCPGHEMETGDDPNNLQTALSHMHDLFRCPGYIETPVNLLEVLAKVRWGGELAKPDPGTFYLSMDGMVKQIFENLRIEE